MRTTVATRICAAISVATLACQAAQINATRAVTAPAPALIGETPATGSSMPVVSGDARYVAFVSRSPNLLSNSIGGNYQIFLRDLTSSNIVLVSATPTNTGGNDHSILPSVSSNGLWIAFESEASDLVANDTNGVSDIFVRDVAGGQTIMVSGGNGPAHNPIISADGRYVAFESRASDLFLEDTNRAADVFSRDLFSDTITLVSVNVAGTGTANRGSELLTMTPDDRFVAFWSSATDIFADVTNTIGEVYVRDTKAGINYCLTKTVAFLNNRRLKIALTPEGKYAALQELSYAGAASGGRIFRADVFGGSLSNVYCCGRPGSGLAISDDGSRLIFPGNDGLYIREMSSTNRLLVHDAVIGFETPLNIASFEVSHGFGRLLYVMPLTNSQLFSYDLSSDQVTLIGTKGILSPFGMDYSGSIVAFETIADDLGVSDVNRAPDVFVTGYGLIAPRHPDLPEGTGMGYGSFNRGNVNANGRRLSFLSTDSSLVSNDINGQFDLFIWDFTSNSVINIGGVLRSNTAIGPAISADGGSVVYERSVGADLSPRRGELFRADLSTGELLQLAAAAGGPPTAHWQPSVSQDGRWLVVQDGIHIRISDLRTPPLPGQISNQVVDASYNSVNEGNGASFTPTISLDGQWVAFISYATSLTTDAGFPPNAPQAFARNIRQRRTRLLSINAAGNPLAGGGTNVTLSANARYVSYQTYIGTNIYRHDLFGSGPAANTLVCANCSGASMSGNGQLVAYQSQGQIYVRDTENAVTELIGGNQAKDASISVDGRFVTYVSKQAGVSQIYLRNRWTATTHLISRNYVGSSPGNGPSSIPVMSHDGRTIAFQSFASDLVPGDYNGRRDIFVVLIAPVDSDGDGMDDDWEMHYFGTLDRDGSGNFDGDHETDLEEYLAGTDPTDPASSLRFTGIGRARRDPYFDTELSWSSAPGKTYRIQHKASLTAPWSDLPGDIMTGGPRGTASDLRHMLVAPRTSFYRVQLVE